MSQREKAENDKVYLSIVQGTLRESVPKGTPGAVPRQWEAGGRTGEKYEIIDRAIKGTIVGVSFYEGEYEGKKFQTLNITLDKDGTDKYPVITTGIDTRYAQDLLKKLPNVNFDEEVRIRPYSYTPEGRDKPTTGVEITHRDPVTGQFDKKVQSFFDGYDKDEKKFTYANGFPKPEGDTRDFSSDDWKIYFLQVKRFLISYTREKIIPRFAATAVPQHDASLDAFDQAIDGSTATKQTVDINPDDIPF